MVKPAKPVPEGLHTVTPHLVVDGAAEAIEFYKRAFGAQEKGREVGPDGKSIMHADIRIGDSAVFLSDIFPNMDTQPPRKAGTTTVTLHLYVPNADEVFNRAVKAGAKPTMPLMDAFWGDRYGKITDPFGHVWAIAQHIEDLTREEMDKRGREFFAQMAQQPQPAS